MEAVSIRKVRVIDEPLARELIALQKSSYRIEAALLGYWEIPYLSETAELLIASNETFLIAFKDRQPVGMLSYKLEGLQADIYRLVVHPGQFRTGIGIGLLRSLEKEENVNEILVQTGADNEPALALYRHAGYRTIRTRILENQLKVAEMVKRLPQT